MGISDHCQAGCAGRSEANPVSNTTWFVNIELATFRSVLPQPAPKAKIKLSVRSQIKPYRIIYDILYYSVHYHHVYQDPISRKDHVHIETTGGKLVLFK